MAREFDLACQAVLNRHDLEIEKMRLSVWGVPRDGKSETKTKTAQPPKPSNQTMTREDIMRNYK